MKAIAPALGLALGLAVTVAALPAPAAAYWGHPHKRICVTKWPHGHRVRTCVWR